MAAVTDAAGALVDSLGGGAVGDLTHDELGGLVPRPGRCRPGLTR